MNVTSATTRQSYRPDIDGMRAIAVLAVIAFHANPSLVQGGFVGVDIFFVISGFLITGLIAKGIEAGNFTFTEFYTRRIKRIFPAYILVAVTTLAVSSYLLIPNDYIFYTTSLAASFAFVSNVFFSMLSWGYFGQRTEEFPLLHTWSLSVEEQFYFIFPILLIFLFKYLRRHVVSALLLLGCLFVALSQLKTGEVKSYFLLTSRAHELIIGAVAWFISQRVPARPGILANLLAAAGLALMLGSVFQINQGMPYPGINSLYPCIGAALLIYAGSADNILRPVLASRAMVRVGLISYSLYLWHWPIFSFLRYRRIALTLPVTTAAIALAFALSWLTWKFVEVPIRRSGAFRFRKAFVQLYLVPAAAFMSIGLYSYLTEGAPERFSSEIRDLISSYSFERDLARSCSIRAEDYQKVTMAHLMQYCAFGDMSQKKADILLIGDSHANHFKPFIDQLAKDAGMKAVFHVQGGCFPTEFPPAGTSDANTVGACEKRNEDLLEMAGNFKYVAVAGFWASEPQRPFARTIPALVEKILQAGAIPVVFKDNPYYEPDLSRCILYRKRGWIGPEQNCNIPYRFVAQSQATPDAIIDRIKAKHPEVLVIDPKRIMCNKAECRTYIQNIALYKDDNHINTRAAALLGDQYIAREGNPFLRPGVIRAGTTGTPDDRPLAVTSH
ncbi:MAG TPA: acyltransferase family protein [Noviherbaspirillum sp.]|uniref:acyltransferase family protein n=1 Tax=Noviherbaspirillum sp. TaxID=1926288 RepID=UPI002B45F4C9|nr:acyltransferase family protein [Noviherbaspirillum sp.]HJV86993.1 acyltransferase family protein [Noviherbaspirillum sp.]